MKIKGVTRHILLEVSDEELEFIIDKLKESEDDSAKNLARALKEALQDQVKE